MNKEYMQTKHNLLYRMKRPRCTVMTGSAISFSDSGQWQYIDKKDDIKCKDIHWFVRGRFRNTNAQRIENANMIRQIWPLTEDNMVMLS